MNTTTAPTPAADLRRQIANWHADRRQHYQGPTPVNELLSDFKSRTHGNSYVTQRSFRRALRAATGVRSVKVGKLWHADLHAVQGIHRVQEPCTDTPERVANPDAIAWLLGLFAAPTQHNPGH